MRISDWSSDVCSSDLVVKTALEPPIVGCVGQNPRRQLLVESDAPSELLESGVGICQARLQAAAARHWQKGKLRESLHATALDGVAKAAGNVGAGPKRHRRLAECRTGFRSDLGTEAERLEWRDCRSGDRAVGLSA